MLLSQEELVWLRYRLSRELYRMKRPEISDLLARATFIAKGRELWISIPGAHDKALTPMFSTAVLNSGVPFDLAILC